MRYDKFNICTYFFPIGLHVFAEDIDDKLFNVNTYSTSYMITSRCTYHLLIKDQSFYSCTIIKYECVNRKLRKLTENLPKRNPP
jgi:hypothetical protein